MANPFVIYFNLLLNNNFYQTLRLEPAFVQIQRIEMMEF